MAEPASEIRQFTHRPVDPGTRAFGRVNWRGLWTLCVRECRRFLAIPTQTVLAPLVTAGLFLLIFSIAIGTGRADVKGVPILTFIAPGLVMMTVIQNAFANTSSSLMSAKVMGNIVDTLMPPLSPLELTVGYLVGGVVRGVVISAVFVIAVWLVIGITVAHPLWFIAFVTLGALFMGALGLIAAVLAQKFDHMSAITNFIVTPLAFLSGTFYSIEALPEPLEQITRFNPMFYIIDGGRYGMLGLSDAVPGLGLGAVALATVLLCAVVWLFFRSGYRLKS